ncbi:MAG: peptidylprolyl isomerase, partial [Promethearchaeota archaeon]
KVLMKTNKGDIVIELYPEHAPGTVQNFLSLTKKGFYNGVLFHRVIPDFVVQGGDPLTKDPSKRHLWGTGGPGYHIKCEVDNNPLIHKPGALSMAHAGRDTGGSQFFIVLKRETTKHLDGQHTVFGQVISGMDVVYNIAQEDKLIEMSVLEE